MFAVMKTGGKQYKVTKGDMLRVERIAAEAGDTVQFNDVLMVNSKIGVPTVEGAGVQAEVVDQIKGEKVIHFVKRRRKHSSKRTKGHRQKLTLIKITEILESGADTSGVMAAIGTGSVPKAKTDASAKAAPAKASPAPKADATEEADEGILSALKPSNLLEAARDGLPDDLKLISGVGPKLEALLNENGVFHFDQIAAWVEDEIEYMDKKLNFKGRIGRDNWIAQAIEFMKR